MSKPKGRKIRRGLRYAVEAVIAAFLFAFHLAFQYTPLGHWGMLVPLVPYIISLLTYPTSHNLDTLRWLLFSKKLIFGQIVAVAGFIIFLMACIRFLRSRGKLVTTAVYSVVRHPQYLGITLMTLGISIMCMQYARSGHIVVFRMQIGDMPQIWEIEIWHIWLISTLGYVLLACYEERHLLKEYKEEYEKYRQKVPLIFPIPCPTKIPESLFSMGLALIIIFLCIFIVATF